MISFLRGKVAERHSTYVIVDVGGVGYQVFIPLSSFEKIPPVPQEVFLFTHLTIREDAHILFGFATNEERELFRLLIEKVSGIGPKMAMSILSGSSIPQFTSAVMTGDIKQLSSLPGIGKKTAERIVVELKDKFKGGTLSPAPLAVLDNPKANDAVLALVALGFKESEAWQSVRLLQSQPEYANATVENLVRNSLKKLG
ncbi:MAG: Holliday junction branch migration protein RuvA [Verrucomicrobiota bacterium]|nr:Holliday junction branch migration protein RuvA [Verrucomicrobiota bacterium]